MGGDSERWEKVAAERDRKAEERSGLPTTVRHDDGSVSGVIAACPKHGASGMSINYKGDPVVHCAHCTAEFAEGQDARLDAMVEDATEKLAAWITAGALDFWDGGPRRQAFSNALRDLVKEARRR